MPGIVGIIHRQDNGPANGKIHKLLYPLQRQEWHTAVVKSATCAQIGSVQIEPELRIAQRGGTILAWAGEIVEQGVIRARLRAPLADNATFAEVLLRRMQEDGPRALCGLNGIYAIAVWDDSAERLYLINDRYGIQKLYLYSEDDEFAFSSEMKSFAGAGRKISPLGAAQLLSLGYLLDNETLSEDIQLLTPASLLTLEQGRVTVETYWRHNFDGGGGNHQPVSAYVNGLAERVEAAIIRRMRPDSAILVTGGLDSRLLAGVWTRVGSGLTTDAISLGQPQASDVITGREVAQALGLPFHHIPLTPSYLADFAEQGVWITEGNMNIYASWILAANSAFRPNGIRYALSGVGGEAAAGRHMLLEALPRTWEEGLEGFFQALNFLRVGSLLKNDLAGNLMEQIRGSIECTIREAPASHWLNKLDYYGYHQSLRRHATSVDVFADDAHPLDPLLDNDLIDYVQTIPPELRARGYLYKRLIRSTLPEIATIGTVLRGPILRPRLEKSFSSVSSFSRRARRRIRRLANKTTLPDNPEGYIQPNAWLRGGSKAFALAVFDQADRLEHLLNMDAVQQLVNDHMSGRRNEYALVTGVMTLILWQKMFVDGDMVPLGSREILFALPQEVAV